MIKQISSKDNLIVKKIKQLDAKKFRDKYNEFLIEGYHLLNEILESGGEVHTIIYSDGFLEEVDGTELIQYFLDKRVAVYCVDDKLFSYMSDTKTPQGIIAVAEKPTWNLDHLLKKEGSNFLLLDRVQDPGNMGTMIRTAEAAGYGGVVVMKGSVDPYSSKVVRSTAGAILRMPIIYFEDAKESIAVLKNIKKKILCTDPRGDVPYYDIDLKTNMVVVIGNEARGICDDFMNACDYRISIPMYGKTESLNASVAASILMYETVRQKMRGEN